MFGMSVFFQFLLASIMFGSVCVRSTQPASCDLLPFLMCFHLAYLALLRLLGVFLGIK